MHKDFVLAGHLTSLWPRERDAHSEVPGAIDEVYIRVLPSDT